MSRSQSTLLLTAAFAVTGALGAQASPDSTAKPLRSRTTYEDMLLFSQVLNQIRVNHADSVDTHELLMAAVEGMVHAADPHSYVARYAPLSAEKEKAYHDGKLYPVPVGFQFIEGAPIVVGVTPGTAAARLDILVGDELIAVDGKPVLVESEVALDVLLAGAKNTSVKLTFERRRVDGSFVALEREVKRERAGDSENAVPTAFLLDAKTGYVRVTTFVAEHIGDSLHDALNRVEWRGAQRVVLDLRDNGGGSVREAANVAGEFLPSGTIVYTQEGRKKDVADTGRVSRRWPWNSEKRIPIVLMINEGTASASELVAGALQDHDRALIVGRPSFGKALVMYGLPMSDGSTIWLVTGHVRTPCGRVVQRQYHAISRHEYYRLARADRDTAGRPSCKTDGGRVVYGGGGIYPDILFAERPAPPAWLSRMREEELPLKWLGGYVTAAGASLPSLDQLAANPHLPPAAIAQFREFATQAGVAIPAGTEADSLLERTLVRGVARIKWGDAGYYRLAAVLDADVAQAVAAFDRAQAILGPSH